MRICPARRFPAVLVCAVAIALATMPAGVAVAASVDAQGHGGFPVTVHSGDGLVTIAARPGRILCLSPSATQMLYELGAGSQVVGVDKYSTWPTNAPRTNFTGAETSAEDYLPLRPDLVILAYPSGTLVQQLQKLGVPALILPPATTLASVGSQLGELATATGHRAQAAAVEASMKADIAAAQHRAGGAGEGKTYYIELDPTLYTATSGTFIGTEFSLFGLRDIADKAGRGPGYPQIAAEYLLAANPDYVFLADTVCCHQSPLSFARRPGFSVLTAVRSHHVFGVNDSVASEWGPHTIEQFVAFLAGTLHP